MRWLALLPVLLLGVPVAKQDVKVELSYDGAWNDATLGEEVLTRNPIEVTHGRADEISSTPPSGASLTLKSVDGKYNPRHPNSPLFGIAGNMPGRITVGSDVRMYGEAASWKPGFPIKGTAWTDLRLAGTLRRLGQGNPPVRSALHRTVVGGDAPAGYWPLEGGTAAVALPCAAGNSSTAVVLAGSTGATFGEQAPPVGSEPLPTFGPATANVTSSGALTASVGTVKATIDPVLSDTAWHFGFVMRAIAPQTPAGSLMWLPVWVDVGTSSLRALVYTSYSGGAFGASHGVDILGLAVAGTVAGGFTSFHPWQDGEWHSYWVELAQSGGNIEANLYVDGVLRDTRTQAGTLSRPVAWYGPTLADGTIDAVADNNINSALSIGHVIFGDSTHGPSRDDWHDAVNGWAGETTGNRFTRLCTEEGITATIVGDADDTPEMGPQFPDTFVNLLREIETTDDGFIYDLRADEGLGMRTGRSTWNQDPVLTLDWNAFEVAPPLEPVVDDLNVRNDVTAARRSGGSARAVRETGPLNVSNPADDPEGVGRYTHQVDVNPFSDLVLPAYAGWHLHRGTVDETRWPAVTIDLDATPDLDVSSVEIGDRLTIVNMPAEITPDTVSLIILGWTETIGSHRRRITFNCAPESALHVAEVEGPYSIVGNNTTHRDTGAGAISNTQTTMNLNVGAGHDWSFESAFDIEIGGERMTVTAIGAASGTYPDRIQQFTVVRSVNGVVKSHPEGSMVRVVNRSYIGL